MRFLKKKNKKDQRGSKILHLQDIPLVGPATAQILIENNIKNPNQLADLDSNHVLSQRINSFELIREYAIAIVNKEIKINKGIQSEFENIKDHNIYFFDAEYDPVGTKNGPYGIFLLGWMNREGKVKQLFLDNPDNELEMLMEFKEWIVQENPLLIAYSSKSADEPQLRNSFNRFNLPITILGNRFFDIYRNVISTQNSKRQKIYLPINSFKQTNISDYLGYRSRKIPISGGLDALLKYRSFLEESWKIRKNSIKRQLLKYNRDDLKRLKFISEKLWDLLL